MRTYKGNVGANHFRAKHSDDVVRQAREMREQGKTYTEIARHCNANWRTVADWCNYATRWAI